MYIYICYFDAKILGIEELWKKYIYTSINIVEHLLKETPF